MSTANSIGLTQEQVNYFWSLVQRLSKGNPDICWEWGRATTWRGYGSIMFNCRKFSTHRLAWMIANDREIPPGMHVCHSCDNPRCCNPSHLSIGTEADNQREKIEKKRHSFGTNHGMSKLNDTAVRYIRRLRKEGESINSLAKGFRIERTTIYQIILGKTWRHVSDEPIHQNPELF